MIVFKWNDDWTLVQNFREWWRIDTLEAITFSEEPLYEREAAERFVRLYRVGSVEEIMERYKKVVDNPTQ